VRRTVRVCRLLSGAGHPQPSRAHGDGMVFGACGNDLRWRRPRGMARRPCEVPEYRLMTTPIIEMQALGKNFSIYLRQQGLAGAVRTLFSTKRRIVHAVCGLSCSIGSGELVGVIGANGAGKSTTIKMLTGVLVPTSGSVHVCGTVPHRDRRANAQHI